MKSQCRACYSFGKEGPALRYYVNKIAQYDTGDHEVHRATCGRLPDAENRLYLGEFASSYEALIAAKRYYARADGCAYCCPEIHHS